MEWMLKRRFIIRAAQRPGGDNSRKWLYSKRERQWRRRRRRRIAPLVWCRTLKPGPRGPESSSLASLDKIPKVMVARDDASTRLFVHQMECLTNRVTDNEESKTVTVLVLPFFPVSLFNVTCSLFPSHGLCLSVLISITILENMCENWFDSRCLHLYGYDYYYYYLMLSHWSILITPDWDRITVLNCSVPSSPVGGWLFYLDICHFFNHRKLVENITWLHPLVANCNQTVPSTERKQVTSLRPDYG